MPWAVSKDGRQVGKFYDTKIQAITEAKEKGHVIIMKGKPYLAEGVEVKETVDTTKIVKEYRFTVREQLKRNRIYIIKAKDEEEARDLLNGFKQIPKEEDATQEDIVVDDYDIEYVDRKDPQIDESVRYLNGDTGFISSIKGQWLTIKLVNKAALLKQSHYFDWDEDQNLWFEM